MRIQLGVLALGVACALAAGGAWARERHRLDLAVRGGAPRSAAPETAVDSSAPAAAPIPESAPAGADPAVPPAIEAAFARLLRGECAPEDAADALRALPAGDAVAALRAAWPAMEDPELRLAVLEALWKEPPHAALIDLMDLGMRDSDANVEAFAAHALFAVSFREFVGHGKEYEEWRTGVKGLSLEEATRAGAADVMARMRAEWPRVTELRDLGWRLQNAPEVASRAIREAGLKTWFEEILATGGTTEKVVALRNIDSVRPDEGWCREHVLPMLSNREMAPIALEFLGRRRNTWAFEDLRLVAQSADPDLASRARDALCRLRDPRALPLFIEQLRAPANAPLHPRQSAIAALHLVAGIPWRPGHDAAWWLRWWEERGRSEFGGETK